MSRIIKPVSLLAIVLFCTCTQKPQNSNTLLIASAANMQYVMEELINDFKALSGIECTLVVGSSGKLLAQIKEGAPYDVFVAANLNYPMDLYRSGATIDTPTVYAYGKLVLWSVVEGIEVSVDILKTPSVQHIAIANPKLAPYGLAAMEVLSKLGILEEVKHKLVYGESVSQTNQFITSGAAQLGFTSKSVVVSGPAKGKGKWVELDENWYKPIHQASVVIKRKDKEAGNALKFNEFLQSDKAKAVFLRHGYRVPEGKPLIHFKTI